MKKLPHLSLFTVMMFFALNASACGMGEQADGYENVHVEHAYQHWQQGVKSPVPFMLLDVRTAEEYAEGHIKGALLIPVQELQARVAEVPKEKRVYVYCHSGVRSLRATNILVKAGYTNIENVRGGMVAWKDAGYPIVK